MTTILLFHPDPSTSRVNRALTRAAACLPGIDVVDIAVLYPDGEVDHETEARRLLRAERLVLQFPVHWYSTPPIYQAWADAVFTRMFYILPHEGAALAGRPVMVAATAGSERQVYAPGERNYAPLDELLVPLRATAHRCGLAWADPFLLHGTNGIDDASLATAAARYADRLAHWASPALGKAA